NVTGVPALVAAGPLGGDQPLLLVEPQRRRADAGALDHLPDRQVILERFHLTSTLLEVLRSRHGPQPADRNGRNRPGRRIRAPADPPTVGYDSLAAAAGVLAAAIDAGDLDCIDTAAAWLGPRARPDQIVGLLSGAALDRLSAAGHGNIYFALLARTQPRGLPMQ